MCPTHNVEKVNVLHEAALRKISYERERIRMVCLVLMYTHDIIIQIRRVFKNGLDSRFPVALECNHASMPFASIRPIMLTELIFFHTNLHTNPPKKNDRTHNLLCYDTALLKLVGLQQITCCSYRVD